MRHASPGTIRRHGERGTVVLLAAIAVLFIVGVMVLAIDLGYVLSVRGQLQNGIDAAALAGVAGLRAAIEPGGATTEQDRLVRELAKNFAGRNYIRTADQIQNLRLDETDISADPLNPLRIVVTRRVSAPLIFAGSFGLTAISVSAGAVGTVTPVDGGTGIISGCWRPLLLPDTFFDANGQVWAVGGTDFSNYAQAVRAGAKLPTLAGDYYRSRFATTSGVRSVYPFVGGFNGGAVGTGVTSLRDTRVREDLKIYGGTNLIAQPIQFLPSDYRVIDFTGAGDAVALYDQAFSGVCTSVRVGQQVRVFSPADAAAYSQVSYGLADLWFNSMTNPSDTISTSEFQTYRYIKSNAYPSPNTHPRIVPVLLFNPLELVNNPNAEYLTVTNVGAFYLDLAGAGNPKLYGYFFREVMIGGLPLEQANAVPDANRALLPAMVQLSR